MSEEIQTLHVPFRKWLSAQPGIAFTYHRPDLATGGTLGDADYVCYKDGRCIHIEFKDKNTPISASQKTRHAELAAAGVKVHVIRSLDAAIELVNAWATGWTAEAQTSGRPVTVFGQRYREVNGQLFKV